MGILAKIKKVSYDLMESAVRNIGGGIGERIRYRLYKSRFKSCGVNVKFGIGVSIVAPECVTIGDNVWIDDYCILIAGMPPTFSGREVRRFKNDHYDGENGHLVIGCGVHIAPFCLVNAFGGGISIGDYCALASGVKMYSMTNLSKSNSHPSKITYCNPMVKHRPVVVAISPIVLGQNCLIALNATILGGSVGKDSSVSPYSLVVGNFGANSTISGNPAMRIGERFEDYK